MSVSQDPTQLAVEMAMQQAADMLTDERGTYLAFDNLQITLDFHSGSGMVEVRLGNAILTQSSVKMQKAIGSQLGVVNLNVPIPRAYFQLWSNS